MDDLKLISYCGLYCGLCGDRCRIPKRAKKLKESMTTEGYDKWGSSLTGFDEFWKFLEGLCEPETCCPGCRQGGGAPSCSIKKCIVDKKVDICVFCDEYPCKRILGLAKGYPTLIPDGKRLKKVGLETWVKEQQQRAKTGFAYCDIRCYPYGIPEE